MKVKLKSVKEVLDMEQARRNNYSTIEEMLCYIPERFFGKTIEAEYQDLKYAEVYFTQNKQWAIPCDFVKKVLQWED